MTPMVHMLYSEVKYFVKSNLYAAAAFLGFMMPLLCFAVAKMSFPVPIVLQVILIACVQFALYCAKWYASKIGKGRSIPVPMKRFTQVSEDGEVSVETGRIQEMLLYVADVEDYLERHGMIDSEKVGHP